MSAFTFLVLSLLAALVRAVPLSPRDVYNPPITNPNAQTVWHPGEVQLVTWYVFYVKPLSSLNSPSF